MAAAIAGSSRIIDTDTFAVAAASAEQSKQQIKLIYGAGSKMDGRDKPAAGVNTELTWFFVAQYMIGECALAS